MGLFQRVKEGKSTRVQLKTGLDIILQMLDHILFSPLRLPAHLVRVDRDLFATKALMLAKSTNFLKEPLTMRPSLHEQTREENQVHQQPAHS